MNEPLQFVPLNKAYSDPFGKLLAEVFLAREPLARCLKTPMEEIRKSMTDLCQMTEFHRHSIIVLSDGQVIAGLLAGDFLAPKSEEDNPVEALLNELTADFR